MPHRDNENYETFVCTGCGCLTTRLRESFDFPICVVCRWLDEADPTGTLRKHYNKDE